MNEYGYKWVWLPTRFAIYARDRFRCAACRKRKWWKAGLSLDHVIPGGGNAPTNLVTLCIDCNTDKGRTPLAEWRPDIVDRVRVATSLPIDRAKGRKLVEQIKPGWYERHRAKDARRRDRLRRGEDASYFPAFEEYADAAE